MANQKDRRNRRPTFSSLGQPQVNRYRHPINAGIPCGGELRQIRETLACQSEMLEQILTLLHGREEGG